MVCRSERLSGCKAQHQESGGGEHYGAEADCNSDESDPIHGELNAIDQVNEYPTQTVKWLGY